MEKRSADLAAEVEAQTKAFEEAAAKKAAAEAEAVAAAPAAEAAPPAEVGAALPEECMRWPACAGHVLGTW